MNDISYTSLSDDRADRHKKRKRRKVEKKKVTSRKRKVCEQREPYGAVPAFEWRGWLQQQQPGTR